MSSIVKKKTCFKTPIFEVEELQIKDKRTLVDNKLNYYHRINCNNWVNVLALTERNQKAIFFSKFRNLLI